jgi:hypothetical protein
MANRSKKDNFISFDYSSHSKFFGLKIEKEKMRKAILRAGYNPMISFSKFSRLKFKFDGYSVSAQTILRNFGLKRRCEQNMCMFLSEIGLEHKKRLPECFDFTDPIQLRLAIIRSKIDLEHVNLYKFMHKRIILNGFELTGRRFLIEYQKVLKKRKLLKIDNASIACRSSLIDLLHRAGFDVPAYNLSVDNPNKSLLRKILESANFNFEKDKFTTTQFLKMKFKSYIYHDGRNEGFFTGQGLLRHYFKEKVKYRMDYVLRMLKDAGYDIQYEK